MMMQFLTPIPVIVEEGKRGFALYVTNSGNFENDVWCICLCDGGIVRHYKSNQIKIEQNATFEIKKTDESS
jgi:hypothetical protein